MSRGRVIDEPAARPFRPPERSGAAGGSAEELAARRVEDSVRSGYEEGLRQGREEAGKILADELARARESLAQATGELHGLAERVLDLVRDEIVGLALMIASRIVRERIDAGDPDAVRIADEMRGKLGKGVSCRLHVHPEDRDALLDARPDLREPGLVELVADRTIARGGLVIESGDEQLDARLGTAFQALWDVVADES